MSLGLKFLGLLGSSLHAVPTAFDAYTNWLHISYQQIHFVHKANTRGQKQGSQPASGTTNADFTTLSTKMKVLIFAVVSEYTGALAWGLLPLALCARATHNRPDKRSAFRSLLCLHTASWSAMLLLSLLKLRIRQIPLSARLQVRFVWGNNSTKIHRYR